MLAILRRRAGLTQEQAAEAIGIAASNWFHVEQGIWSNSRMGTFRNMCRLVRPGPLDWYELLVVTPPDLVLEFKEACKKARKWNYRDQLDLLMREFIRKVGKDGKVQKKAGGD